jgi:cytochrome c biogenesis protein CcdA
MKFIRNIYFWLALGSVVVVIGGDALYRDYNPNSKEAQQAAEERSTEGESPTLLDPYLAGFFTAVVLGGCWYGILRRR